MEKEAEQAAISGSPVDTIKVHISYEIIKLFSEGLYQSPHKAIEELVSNGYDAGATDVHVVLPEVGDGQDAVLAPLYVIDNGHGMDAEGFHQLWRVANSKKSSVGADQDAARAPIGQFGIGKLAAYVLAWRLDHVSRSGDGVIRLTQMNFRRIEGRHQHEGPDALDVQLMELSPEQARELLSDVESRDQVAWNRLFGDDADETWTVAVLSDFKNLYDRLSSGRLAWVLSTGLPLHSNFRMWLNGAQIESSKEKRKIIKSVVLGSGDDAAADRHEGIEKRPQGGVQVEGIDGAVSGEARIFEDRLTAGKSEQYGRSHGFFIRVRGRVINLEDELFGLDVLNHAAWSRFSMEVDADGLRDLLLSSREGVRETEGIRRLRRYLNGVFNICRKAYEDWEKKQLDGLDVEQLLSDAPSLFVTEPLVDGVRRAIDNGESFYLAKPNIPEGTDSSVWLNDYRQAASTSPFGEVLFEATGPYDRALRYVPDSRTLVINTDHPFVDKLVVAGGRNRGAATLFGSSEVLMDVLLQDHGVSRAEVAELLTDRDRVLRLLAGDHPSTAKEVLRRLRVANRDELALERAVGLAFRVLGFEYERRGGYEAGPDGVLFARLGRDSDTLADYRVVYDAKQTEGTSVPADKINLNSIEDFRTDARAHYAFFIAIAYAAQDDPRGKVNRLVAKATSGVDPQKVTLLRIDDLRRIVELHYKYGVPLTRLRSLFEDAHTVPQVEAWVTSLEAELGELEPPVPLHRLLAGLEEAKSDHRARPNVNTVRALDDELRRYEPERLVAALRAVVTLIGERWLEVDKDSRDVKLHHTADRILAELERVRLDLFGSDPSAQPPGA